MTPKASVEAASRALGQRHVVDSCLTVLRNREMDAEFGYVLAGPASVSIMNGMAGGVSGYWPRTWALRALLYAWDVSAESAVIGCLGDEAWRVREMAAKLVARRRIGDALDDVAALQADPVARVRTAAHRALIALVEHDA
jgi:hypothetical protein